MGDTLGQLVPSLAMVVRRGTTWEDEDVGQMPRSRTLLT